MQGQSLLDAEEKALSKLPANARVLHSNESCSGWGLFAAILNSSIVDDASYKHIVMLDSSVRGPFLSPYWPVRPAHHASSRASWLAEGGCG